VLLPVWWIKVNILSTRNPAPGRPSVFRRNVIVPSPAATKAQSKRSRLEKNRRRRLRTERHVTERVVGTVRQYSGRAVTSRGRWRHDRCSCGRRVSMHTDTAHLVIDSAPSTLVHGTRTEPNSSPCQQPRWIRTNRALTVLVSLQPIDAEYCSRDSHARDQWTRAVELGFKKLGFLGLDLKSPV